jgi:hypothetical protein
LLLVLIVFFDNLLDGRDVHGELVVHGAEVAFDLTNLESQRLLTFYKFVCHVCVEVI